MGTYGRNIDVIIAREFMKMNVVHENWPCYYDDYGLNPCLNENDPCADEYHPVYQWRDPIEGFEDGSYYNLVPFYWTNDLDAIGLANALSDRGHIVWLKFDGLRNYPGSARYTVLIDQEDRVDDKNLSSAICIAVLKLYKIKWQ